MALRLSDVVELDGRGTWLGDPTGGAGRDYTLKLVKEGGEWRISDPPDRLIIPRSHFDTEYQQYFLYFFDKSAQVLVPEPVYVPRGLQAPTLLVAALLKGPAPALQGVETTFVPRGTRLDGISVPVTRDNTAEVPLSKEVLDLGDDQLNLLFAQLSWTLGQISGVERMRVTVGRTPVDLAGGRVDVAVTQGSEFDPALAWASTSLFGTRDRRVVTLAGNRESRISGPFGTLPLGLRSIAVDLPAQHVAGVTSDGTRVLESDKDRSRGQAGHPVRRTHGLPAGHRPAAAGLRPLRPAVRRRPDAPAAPGSRWCAPAPRGPSPRPASPGSRSSASCSAATAPGWSPRSAATASTGCSSRGSSATRRAACAGCCPRPRCRSPGSRATRSVTWAGGPPAPSPCCPAPTPARRRCWSSRSTGRRGRRTSARTPSCSATRRCDS